MRRLTKKPTFDLAAAQILGMLKEIYVLGKTDATEEIVNVVGRKTPPSKTNGKIIRASGPAPRGTAKVLVVRALSRGPLTPRQIFDQAKSAKEKQLTYPAIYRELNRGAEKNRYRAVGKQWELVNDKQTLTVDADWLPPAGYRRT